MMQWGRGMLRQAVPQLRTGIGATLAWLNCEWQQFRNVQHLHAAKQAFETYRGHLRNGKIVNLTGETGTGKTTVAQLANLSADVQSSVLIFQLKAKNQEEIRKLLAGYGGGRGA